MNVIYLIGGLLIAKLFYSLYKRKSTNQKITKPEMFTKNKWLYPTDSFGKMEKGVVYDSQIYKMEITDSTNYSDFRIIETNNINGHHKLKN